MSLKNILIGIDQLANTLLGGCPDETLSARAWRLRFKHPALRAVIDGLFFWQPNHCYESWISEQERRHMPGDY